MVNNHKYGGAGFYGIKGAAIHLRNKTFTRGLIIHKSVFF